MVCNHTNVKNIGENMLKRIWKKIKSWIGLNYYFTGILIVMLTVLAFCGGPGVQ
jgi:hypothetical protein